MIRCLCGGRARHVKCATSVPNGAGLRMGGILSESATFDLVLWLVCCLGVDGGWLVGWLFECLRFLLVGCLFCFSFWLCLLNL